MKKKQEITITKKQTIKALQNKQTTKKTITSDTNHDKQWQSRKNKKYNTNKIQKET